MKLFFTRLVILFCMFLPFAGNAQHNDPTLLLRSGSFVPNANIQQLDAKDPVFTKSLFNNKHYVVIQFEKIPGAALKEKIKSSGIILMDYLPRNAYTAVIPANTALQQLKSMEIRSIFQLSAIQKSQTEIYTGQFPEHAIIQAGYIDVSILTYEKLSASDIQSSLQNLGATVLEETPMFRNFRIRVKQENVLQLVELPFVQWVEAIEPPNVPENLLGRSLHRVNVLNDGVRNLKGDGIHIGIWDGGEVSPHLDFSPANRLTIREQTSPVSHSTHCAGTIAGRGIINPKARGMASNAQLYSFNFNGNIQTEMSNAIVNDNLMVSSHSYGSTQTCSLNGAGIAYSNTSRNTDLNLNNFPSHLHVHSAGNSQTACAGGWYTITGSGKSAKNNIVVANISSTQNISGSSSFGPVHDGRIKPEISSFGSGVLSTYTPLNTYATISGTSMATPGVAGTLALLVQRYKQLNSNADPISAFIKNIACNAAEDLGNAGPDYKFGFGRINALASVKIMEANRYAINTIAQSTTNDVQIIVPANTAQLKIMLSWNDPAGTANAALALVNDLDLTVIDPASATFLPWTLNANNPANGAIRAIDTVSNIEQITINNPTAGTYTLRVSGTSIAQGPNQQYALSWIVNQPAIEITYPNGGESMNPGTTEAITWDNPGINGNQTLEYSLDNGSNWTTITTVGPSVTRHTWSPPAANTATALIRVSSGSIADQSDAGFNILGTVSGLNALPANCITGALSFSWNATTNATHYDLFKLDDISGNWVMMAADVSGTSQVVTGLVPDSSMWFTIVAKNNVSNAVSEKAIAINRVVSSSTGGLGTLGTISGTSTICAAASNIVYSVPALTGTPVYTWTVPATANIVSGQGSTSITVSYTTATSGSITVVANQGSCQSTISSLGITNSNNGIAAPVSGGDQSASTCASAPMPVLTATATVPTGFTIVWYTDGTGATVVANPTLNSIGSISYFAASKNTATGCESATRTAVILTITETSAASITAGGPLTICTGETVTLTANSGDSYLWSTGATTQSITVGSSGDYSVTVTEAGCASNAGPETVTVNELPNASITPSGPLSFCEGETVTLLASAANSYLWSNGATTQSISVGTSGVFNVIITNVAGCSDASADVAVQVSPQPNVSISAAPYTKLFPGLSTTLTANVSPVDNYTYSWEKDGDVIPASGNSITVTSNQLGDYRVRITNDGGCENLSDVMEITDSASSKLFVYPNPNTGEFQVSYYSASTNNVYAISIYDAKGAKVFSQQYSIGSSYQSLPVNLSRNSKGIYRVVLHDKNGKKLAAENVLLR